MNSRDFPHGVKTSDSFTNLKHKKYDGTRKHILLEIIIGMSLFDMSARIACCAAITAPL